MKTLRFSLSQRKDVTALEPKDHSEPSSVSNGAKLKGTYESRTWELDHWDLASRPSSSLTSPGALGKFLSLSEPQFLHLSNGKREIMMTLSPGPGSQ